MPLPSNRTGESRTAYLRRIARQYPERYQEAFRVFGAEAAAESWWTRTFG